MRRRSDSDKYVLKFWDVEEGRWIRVKAFSSYEEAVAHQRVMIDDDVPGEDLDIFFNGYAVRPDMKGPRR